MSVRDNCTDIIPSLEGQVESIRNAEECLVLASRASWLGTSLGVFSTLLLVLLLCQHDSVGLISTHRILVTVLKKEKTLLGETKDSHIRIIGSDHILSLTSPG